MSWRRSMLDELVFGALTLALLVPLWSIRYPPFQDFPQYVALARTLADYSVPGLGFKQYFALNFETYVLFAPWLGGLFAWLFDPLVAAKLVVSIVLVATPWGLRALLRSLGRPVEYAAFVLPLAYNAHVMMGFVSYVLGVALMLWAMAFGARLIVEPRRRWQVALGLTSLSCLYSHVVPWAFSVAGFGLALLIGVPPRRWPPLLLPLLPALLLGLRGYLDPNSGWSTVPLGLAKSIPNCPIYDDTRGVFGELPGWISDVFQAEWDERLLLGLFLLGMLIVLAVNSFPPAADGVRMEPGADGLRWVNAAESSERRRARFSFAILAPLGIGLYFVMPRTCDWIWPIHARFLFVGAMLAVLVLPVLPRKLLLALSIGLSLLSLSVTVATTREFRRFEPELGDLAPALAAIPLGQKVAALTVDKGARGIKVAGFHHFGAYCQAERGGLTQFSFATMHHWPIRIRPELGLPEPSWHFQFDPAAINGRELEWANYVLTRGPAPRAVEQQFTPIYQGRHWRVFVRRPER